MLCHQFSADDPSVYGSDTDSHSLPDPACVQPMRRPKRAENATNKETDKRLANCKGKYISERHARFKGAVSRGFRTFLV